MLSRCCVSAASRWWVKTLLGTGDHSIQVKSRTVTGAEGRCVRWLLYPSVRVIASTSFNFFTRCVKLIFRSYPLQVWIHRISIYIVLERVDLKPLHDFITYRDVQCHASVCHVLFMRFSETKLRDAPDTHVDIGFKRTWRLPTFWELAENRLAKNEEL